MARVQIRKRTGSETEFTLVFQTGNRSRASWVRAPNPLVGRGHFMQDRDDFSFAILYQTTLQSCAQPGFV